MEGTSTYLVLKLVGSDSEGATVTKNISIPNPVAQTNFKVSDVENFVDQYNTMYGLNTALSQAYYEVRTRTLVYPEA